jgi:hypothetical protein
MSRRLRWAGHVLCMGQKRLAYNNIFGWPEENRPVGRPRHRWENNINIDLKKLCVRMWTGPICIIFKHPVAFIYTSYTKYTVFNATYIFFILILPRHVFAALGHHRVLLLKLSHCNFYIICSFRYALLFIYLMLCLTLLPFGTSPLLEFTILKILKIYVSVIKFLKLYSY